jgi:hypothetical protein
VKEGGKAVLGLEVALRTAHIMSVASGACLGCSLALAALFPGQILLRRILAGVLVAVVGGWGAAVWSLGEALVRVKYYEEVGSKMAGPWFKLYMAEGLGAFKR